MALRGTEIMVIVRGQNYASQMLRRVSADLKGLQGGADIANANQVRTQARIVAATQKQAQLLSTIQKGPKRAALASNKAEAAHSQAMLSLAARQNALESKRMQLLEAQQNKLNDLEKTHGKIADLSPTNLTSDVALGQISSRNALETKRLSIAAEQSKLDQKAETLGKSLKNQLAQQLGYIQQGRRYGMRSNISEANLKALAENTNIPTRQQQLAYRTLANRQGIATTQAAIANLPAQQLADQDKLNAKVATLAASEKAAGLEIQAQLASVSELNTLEEKQMSQLTRINKLLVDIDDQQKLINAGITTENTNYAEALAKIEAMNEELSITKTSYSEITAEIEAMNTQLATTDKELDAQAARMRTLSKLQTAASTVGAVGRVAQFGGLIGTAALGASAISYAKFTSETTQAATQMANITEKGFGDVTVKAKDLQNVILNLMKSFPASQQDMATSAYNLFSSIPALNGPGGEQKGFALLTAANQAAVAGNTDLNTSTSALIKVMNNFGGEGQSVNQILNRMFAIVRFGNMHFSDFDSMLNQIAPAAKGAGQTLNDLAGVIAESTIHMAPAQAATGLARLLQIFQKPAFTSGAANLGVQVTNKSGKQLLPIMDILDNFAKKFPELQKGGLALANLFKEVTSQGTGGTAGTAGTIQAQKLLNILITNLPELHKLQAQTINDNQEFTRSFDAMSQTSGVKWTIFLNMMKATVLMIGQAVIPVFERLGGKVEQLIRWFDNLSPSVKGVVGQFAAWGSIGLLLGGTLLHIGGSVTSLILNMKLLTGAGSLLSMGFLGIGIIAGIAAIYIITHWKQVQVWWQAFTKALPQEWNGAMLVILGSAETTAGAILTAFIKVDTILSGMFTKAGKKVGSEIDKNFGFGAVKIPTGGLFSSIGGAVGGAVPNPIPAPPKSFQKYAEQLAALGVKTTQKGAKQAYDAWNQAYLQINAASSKSAAKQKQNLDNSSAYQHPQVQAAIAAATGATTTGSKTSNETYIQQMKDAQKLLSDPTAFNKYVQSLSTSSAEQAEFQKLINQSTNALKTQATQAADQANAVVSAEQSMATKINGIVGRLQTLFNNFQTANETMFGTLGQGRTMQGPLGQVYSQLAQYNIAPPFQLILQDLKSQDKDFEQFRGNLNKLKKEGVPKPMLDELQALGPDGRLMVQTLANTGKAGVKAYIAAWKEKQGDIEKATTIDYNNKLGEYLSYGKKVALAILEGLKSQAPYLKKGFQQYILAGAMGDEMKAWIMKEFPTIISDAGKAAAAKFEQKAAAKAAAKAKVLKGGTRSLQSTTPHGKEGVVNTTGKVETHYHYTQEIHAREKENMSAVLRRALHEYKTGVTRYA